MNTRANIRYLRGRGECSETKLQEQRAEEVAKETIDGAQDAYVAAKEARVGAQIKANNESKETNFNTRVT